MTGKSKKFVASRNEDAGQSAASEFDFSDDEVILSDLDKGADAAEGVQLGDDAAAPVGDDTRRCSSALCLLDIAADALVQLLSTWLWVTWTLCTLTSRRKASPRVKRSSAFT